MSTKVKLEHVYKVFGDSPQEAIRLLEEGADKEAILRETGNVVGVADASFEVEQGHIFMVMGLSGSGKSTLVRCINRLIAPTAGQVLIDDLDVVSLSDEKMRELRRTRMAMVFQHFALFPHKTVLENVEYGLKVRGIDPGQRREIARQTLTTVGLEGWGERRPESLSGGMQQRVGLARALATDPEILLMDEAFSALDPLIRREMQDELIQLQRTVQKTIIFITHDLSEALKLGDRVAVMKDGRIIQIGTPEEIVSGPADEYVAAFTQEVDRGRVFTVSSIMRDAETLAQGHDSVRTAMFRMRGSRNDALFIVDREQKPVGLVLQQDIARAVREGVQDLGQVTTAFATTVASAPLVEVYNLCAENIPIAVVDERERLIGEVHPLDLLANLAPDTLGQPDRGEADLTVDAPGAVESSSGSPVSAS